MGVLVMMGHFSSTMANVPDATRSMVAAIIKKKNNYFEFKKKNSSQVIDHEKLSAGREGQG